MSGWVFSVIPINFSALIWHKIYHLDTQFNSLFNVPDTMIIIIQLIDIGVFICSFFPFMLKYIIKVEVVGILLVLNHSLCYILIIVKLSSSNPMRISIQYIL